MGGGSGLSFGVCGWWAIREQADEGWLVGGGIVFLVESEQVQLDVVVFPPFARISLALQPSLGSDDANACTHVGSDQSCT